MLIKHSEIGITGEQKLQELWGNIPHLDAAIPHTRSIREEDVRLLSIETAEAGVRNTFHAARNACNQTHGEEIERERAYTQAGRQHTIMNINAHLYLTLSCSCNPII